MLQELAWYPAHTEDGTVKSVLVAAASITFSNAPRSLLTTLRATLHASFITFETVGTLLDISKQLERKSPFEVLTHAGLS